MPVQTSSYTLDPVIQKDGSRWCTETHTMASGKQFAVYYLLASGDDPDAIMAGRVAYVLQSFKDEENAAAVEIDADPALVDLTTAELS